MAVWLIEGSELSPLQVWLEDVMSSHSYMPVCNPLRCPLGHFCLSPPLYCTSCCFSFVCYTLINDSGELWVPDCKGLTMRGVNWRQAVGVGTAPLVLIWDNVLLQVECSNYITELGWFCLSCFTADYNLSSCCANVGVLILVWLASQLRYKF